MGKNPKCFSLVEINYFDMTEIKLGSKKYFHFFSKIFFFWGGRGNPNKHVPKEHFDETTDSGKKCSIQEMSATSVLGLIQAI